MGIEPTEDSPDNPTPAAAGGAESGALAAENDPDLARLLAAWLTLSEPIRRAVLALVESAGPR
jgi:hypothetical protein